MNPADETQTGAQTEAQIDLLADMLIEEISIDGMCGVY